MVSLAGVTSLSKTFRMTRWQYKSVTVYSILGFDIAQKLLYTSQIKGKTTPV